MTLGYCYLALFCVFATSFARKSQNDNEWALSNTMSKENGEEHEDARYSDTIDIDNTQGWPVDSHDSHASQWPGGSGDGYDDEDDMSRDEEWSSGWGSQDNWESRGNGNNYGHTDPYSGIPPTNAEPRPKTRCQRLYERLIAQPLEGAYIPRCEPNGEYSLTQCDQHVDQCWCVNQYGQEIPFTRGHQVSESYCRNQGKPYNPGRPNAPGNSPDSPKVVNPDPSSPLEPLNEDDGIGYGEEEKDDEFEIVVPNNGDEDSKGDTPLEEDADPHHRSIIGTPGLLPGIIGGAVVGLLCAVLLVMFIVYRMRKKDEGSYALEEPKMTSPSRGYTRAPTKEYWA